MRKEKLAPFIRRLRLEDKINSEMMKIRKKTFTIHSIKRHDILQRRLEKIKATC
jgi:hypothetical protein